MTRTHMSSDPNVLGCIILWIVHLKSIPKPNFEIYISYIKDVHNDFLIYLKRYSGP